MATATDNNKYCFGGQWLMDRQTGHATGDAAWPRLMTIWDASVIIWLSSPSILLSHIRILVSRSGRNGYREWTPTEEPSGGWSGHLYPVSSRLPKHPCPEGIKETPQFARQAEAAASMFRLGSLALSCGHLCKD